MHRSRTCARLALACALALFGAARAQAAEEKPPPPLDVYGFAQADIIEDFRRVDPNWVATLRPSRIPTLHNQFGQNGEAVVSVRQSRFGVKTATDTSFGQIRTQLEWDFFGVGPDQGQTTIRLRHAWGELGMWGAGQTHSVFMDIDVFPNVIDYWGPAGIVFLRTPQIRFTPLRGNLEVAVALDLPSNDIDPGVLREVDPSLSANPHNFLPSLTAHVRLTGARGHVQLAAIARQLGWEVLGAPANEPNGSEFGWGFNLTGDLKFLKKDRLVLSAVFGHGIASYMNDGGVDVTARSQPGGPNTGSAQPLFGWEAYFEHDWSERLSSTLGYSQTIVHNSDLQTATAFHRGDYASVNLVATPLDEVLAGIEVLYGRRDDKGGNEGHDVRLQVSLKYIFSKS